MQLKLEKINILPKKEYLIVYLLEQMPDGYDFGRWPLHITIMPWFEIDDPKQAIDALKNVCKTHKPSWVTVGKTDYFGAKHDLEVNLIANPNPLTSLHKELLETLKSVDAQFPHKKNLARNFMPHITKKSYAKVQPGYKIKIDKIHLIEAPISNRLTRLKKVISIGELQ